MNVFFISVPGEIRTPDRTLRRRMLYPAELLGQIVNLIISLKYQRQLLLYSVEVQMSIKFLIFFQKMERKIFLTHLLI